MTTSDLPPRSSPAGAGVAGQWLPAGAALLLLSLAFGGRLSGDFVWDDVPLVERNQSLVEPAGWWQIVTHDLWGSAGQPSTQLYHPLPMLSFWLQAQLGGLGMVWLRAGNVALHGACAWLLLTLLRRAAAPKRSALLACAVFLVHPLVTEPVMWLTGRHDTLAVLFLMLAVLVFPLRQEPRLGLRLALSAACSAAAFASKEPYVVTPALIALWSLVAQPRTPLRQLGWRWLAPLAGVLAVLALRRALHIPTGSAQLAASPLVHLQTYASVLQHYGLLALSIDQGPTIASVHWLSVPTASGVLVFVSLLLAALYARRRSAPVSLALFGCAWFLLSLLPHVVSLPVLGLWGNRYGYCPLLGLCIALVGLLWLVEERGTPLLRHAAAAAVGLCVLLGLAQTRLAAANFRDDLTLYGASASAGPDDGRALYHYAHAVRMRSGCAGAVALLFRATQLDPSYARAQRNLAGCLLELGQPARALKPAERAVRLEPLVAAHRYNWGAVLLATGQQARGVAELRRALELDPNHRAARRLLASQGQP